MRYLGLVFLGIVLWGGHTAGAVEMTAGWSMEIVTNGKVVDQHTQVTRNQISRAGLTWQETVRTTRIIKGGKLYICEDYVVFHEKVTPDLVNGQVVATCFSDYKQSK